jgi:hypothetical protein
MRKLLIAAIILAGLLVAACRCTWRIRSVGVVPGGVRVSVSAADVAFASRT